jgi:tetratricopeptide (TPR) repeat protein
MAGVLIGKEHRPMNSLPRSRHRKAKQPVAKVELLPPPSGVDESVLKLYNEASDTVVTRGAYEEALALCDRILERDPELAEAWHMKGQALGRLGHYEEKIQCCERALALDPSLCATWGAKAAAHIRAGEHRQALESCERGLERCRTYVPLLTNRAIACAYLDRGEESLASIDEAIALDPANARSAEVKRELEHRIAARGSAPPAKPGAATTSAASAEPPAPTPPLSFPTGETGGQAVTARRRESRAGSGPRKFAARTLPRRLLVLAVVVTAGLAVAGYFVVTSDQSEQSNRSDDIISPGQSDEITAGDEDRSLRVAKRALPRGAEVLSYPDLEAGEAYVFVLSTGETVSVTTSKVNGKWAVTSCDPDPVCVY